MQARRRRLIVLLPLAVILIAIFWPHRVLPTKRPPADLEAQRQQREPITAATEEAAGIALLKGYATPETNAEADLTLLTHTLANYALLAKGDNPIPLGANEDIANALRGRRGSRLRFLPDDHPIFNAQGQLIDRWQTPLYFHALDRARLDIRSAGPDKQMWTPDDIHRHYDGQFLKGEALTPESLYDTTRPKR